jgi:hypothetical protein
MLFQSTRFRSCRDNKPQAEEASWEHFCSRFQKRDIREEKDGPAFSPARYADSLSGFRVEGYINHPKEKDKRVGQIWVNNYGEKIVTDMENAIVRRNENVRLLSMAVFDFDKGESPQAIREKFKDVNHIIYTTHSHTNALTKFRLILPFKDAMKPADFKAAWPFGMENMDPSCKDLARLFYLPSCPKAHEAEAFIWVVADKKFFAPKLPKGAPAPRKEKKRRGDYNTLDGVAWFQVHGAYLGPAGQEHKHFAVCPWAMHHTDGKQGETDSVLWTEPKKWPTFACSHAHCAGKGIQDVMKLWGDADSFCAEEMTADKLRTDTEIRCLGFDDSGRYYYQCNKTNHIVPLKAGEHKELNFYSITADLTYWGKHFADPESGRVSWKAAAAKMMATCHKRGFFRPDAVRGGGVWEDAGRVVAHLGRTLLVDGRVTPLTEFKSTFIYEAMVHEVDLPAPLPMEEMRKVYDLAFRFPLANPKEAVYLAGTAVCGLLSGILAWRPHIWLTGDQASGKSSILTYFLNPLWAPAGGCMAEGRTSDAGIRQKLRRNAYPFIVDESEADTRADADRIEGIVSLARSSSSVSEGRTLKGTISGQGMEFLVRSVFALCSITHSLEKPQDRQRFTLLPCRMTDAHVAAWPDFKKELRATITPEFALGFYARIRELVDTIMDNAAVFQKVIIAQLKCDARVGEHLGHLLAGACALLTPLQLSEASALEFLGQMGALPVADKSESNVPQTALNHLFSFLLRDGMSARTVWEHLEVLRAKMPGFEAADASGSLLKRYGMLYKDKALWVSSNHPLLMKLFKEVGITGHYGLLSLLEGAEAGQMTRFGGHQSRAVKIPLPE